MTRDHPESADLIVLGAGPSALALATASARLGLSVLVVATRPDSPWQPTYSDWADELAGLGLDDCVHTSWVSPLVATDSHGGRCLERRYVRLHTPRLQAFLQVAAARAGVASWAGTAVGIEHDTTGSTVFLQEGVQLRGRLIVDATGGSSGLLLYQEGREPGWQMATGQLVEVEAHPWSPGEMILMDLRRAGGPEAAGQAVASLDRDPSFLYAQPLGRNLLFVEETSLIARPAMGFRRLEARLGLRLAGLGIHVKHVLDEEHCRIPMGGALPRLDQRLLAFGSAAGLVHPATGYQLARALHLAGPLAQAIAEGLDGDDLDRASAHAWGRLWPGEQRRQWELYAFGGDVLCGLDRPQLQAFFDTFFELQPDAWRGFLSASLSTRELAAVMARFFLQAGLPLKRNLALEGTRQRVPLFRAVLGS